MDDVVHMNQHFCGIHATYSMGNTSKGSVKEFEALVAPAITSQGFRKEVQELKDIVWEISKALTHGNGYEVAGAADYFEPFDYDHGLQSKLVSFRGERINVIFIIAGAAYYHRNHIIDFLDYHCIQKNKLLFTLSNVKQVTFLACFRSLDIMGKSVTALLMWLTEQPETIIFSLNDT